MKHEYKTLDTSKHLWQALTLAGLILFSDVLILYPFLTHTYVYMWKGWGYDTYHSYVPVLQMISQSLRRGSLGAMSFTSGLGSDVATYSLFLGNPVFWVIILISAVTAGEAYIPEMMVLVPVIVSIAGGIACQRFLSSKGYSKKAVFIASYMYALSGYLFCTGTHYFFTIGLLYLPLILHAVDLAYEKGTTLWLTLMVFLTGVSSVYFALPICLVTGVYILYREFSVQKKSIKRLGWIAGSTVPGILCSSFLFIPFIYELLCVSGRVDTQGSFAARILNSFHLISGKELLILFSRLLSNNLFGGPEVWAAGPMNTWQVWFCAFPFFLSALFPLLIIQYVISLFTTGDRHSRRRKAVVTALFLLITLTSCLSSLTNLYSYNHWRMGFVLLPFFVWMSCDVLDRLFCQGCFSHVGNLLGGGAIECILAFFYKAGVFTERKVVLYTMVFVACFTLMMELLVQIIKVGVSFFRSGIALLVLIFLIGSNYCMDHRYSLIEGAQTIPYDDAHQYYHDDALTKVLEQIDEHNFARIEKTYAKGNADSAWSLTNYCRTASIYNSTMNQYTQDYITCMVNLQLQDKNTSNFLMYSKEHYGTLFDASRAAILGIRYMLTKNQRDLPEWREVYFDGKTYGYENNTIQSGGILYEKTLTQQEYEALPPEQKILVEPQAIVLEDDILRESQSAGLEYTKRVIDRNQINLEFSGKTQIRKESVTVQTDSNTVVHIPLPKEGLSKNSRHAVILRIQADTGFDLNLCETVGERHYEHSWGIYPGDNTVVCLIDADTDDLSLQTEKAQLFQINEIFELECPIQYSADCLLTNEKMNGQLEGTIQAEKDSALLLSFPYLKGWSAWIDGERTSVIRADYGFSAVLVEAGEHTIFLRYDNPCKFCAWILTGIGILSVIIYQYLERRGRKIRTERAD